MSLAAPQFRSILHPCRIDVSPGRDGGSRVTLTEIFLSPSYTQMQSMAAPPKNGSLRPHQRTSQQELATLANLPIRALRELIRLGAIEKADFTEDGRQAYSAEHLQQAERAKRLMDAGLSIGEAAYMCEALVRTGQAPRAPRFRSLGHVKGRPTTWSSGGVQISVSATCSPEEIRLVKALRNLIAERRHFESMLRRQL